MQKQSFGSVEVTWLDREAVKEAVKKAAGQLARRRPEVQRVVLFGSLAKGTAVPGSDADVLLVLTDSPIPFRDRMSQYRLTGVPVDVDVFPYTQAELDRMMAAGNPFVREALTEGLVIYERVIGRSRESRQRM